MANATDIVSAHDRITGIAFEQISETGYHVNLYPITEHESSLDHSYQNPACRTGRHASSLEHGQKFQPQGTLSSRSC